MKSKRHGLLHYFGTLIYFFLKFLFSSLLWLVITILGIYTFKNSDGIFYKAVIGIPLVLIGIGFMFNNFLDFVYSLINPLFNQGVCPFCSKTVK